MADTLPLWFTSPVTLRLIRIQVGCRPPCCVPSAMSGSPSWVVDYRSRRVTKVRLFEALLTTIEGTEGRVQSGSATFEVVGVPPVVIRQSGLRAGE